MKPTLKPVKSSEFLSSGLTWNPEPGTRNSKIAIVGMACLYPDARTPLELWENVLAGRQAFRRLPPERLRLDDYLSPDRNAPDRTYATEAALIEGYQFDRLKFRVAGATFRAVDLAHWLALDIAAQALADAGFSTVAAPGSAADRAEIPPSGGVGGPADLPRTSTGVLVGNTLTGEFSRANIMRLRWPYVCRVVEASLVEQGWSPEQRLSFLQDLETQFKAPFPSIGEESLAGGLSNTIAGRICNHFDLKGGGYTVDGACASSLLAITTACSALMAGDLDVAIAGGVDLSLDPFELVGFAKTGALAPQEMRVYDAHSAGFWPGEGCGFVVLMRHQDALAQRRRIYALIQGWGVSSDGSGGITRPEVEGQILAVQRAYRRAGFGIQTVAYFEGHGTGTAVGDATELRMLSRARHESDPQAPPALISSIKANIGHTKAAAGVAGLIKATMALYTQVLPPTTGCQTPHPELTVPSPALRVLPQAESWPPAMPLRAGVSAMGFGGINTHLVLEGSATRRRKALNARERTLRASAQDAELFLFSAGDVAELQRQLQHLLPLVPRLSRAELADLAAELASQTQSLTPPSLTPGGRGVRAAVVAATPLQLASRLQMLQSWLNEGTTRRLDFQAGLFLGVGLKAPRLGFLFPGQATPAYRDGGALGRRFPFVQELYTGATFAADAAPEPPLSHPWERGPGGEGIPTAVAQPAIVTASLAALRVLDHLELEAGVAVGHSLGELSALHWAGAIDEPTLLRLATARGQLMADLGHATGTMAHIAAGRDTVEKLLNLPPTQTPLPHSPPVAIACFNAPNQTIISGEATAVAEIVAHARAKGFNAGPIPVSHAFHSPLMAAVAQPLADYLANEAFQPLRRSVVSTVTGDLLTVGEDLRALLQRQVTAPVRFTEAITRVAVAAPGPVLSKAEGSAADRVEIPLSGGLGGQAERAEEVDLLVEVGPGQVLSGLLREWLDTPVVAIDAGGPSLQGLLQTVGAAFALGAPLNPGALFADRFTRPFDLNWQPRFFVNPCELAPVPEAGADLVEAPGGAVADPPSGDRRKDQRGGSEGRNSDREDRVEDPPTTEMNTPQPASAATEPPPAPADAPTTSLLRGGGEGDGAPQEPVLDLVRRLVAQRAELPLSAIGDDDRLLSELHLNSITVSQLVAEAARRLHLSPPVAPTEYADVTVAGLAQALEELMRTGSATPGAAGPVRDEERRLALGVDAWVRPFTVELVERPLPPPRAPDPGSAGAHQRSRQIDKPAGQTDPAKAKGATGSSAWRVIAPPKHPLGESLKQAFAQAPGNGIVVCLPPQPDESHLSLLLTGVRELFKLEVTGPESEADGADRAADSARPDRFVLVQHGGGAAAFARTLHLEAPEVTTCVVDVPLDHPQAITWAVAEATATADPPLGGDRGGGCAADKAADAERNSPLSQAWKRGPGGEGRISAGHTEAYYDRAGRRYEPVLRVLPLETGLSPLPLGPDDVLLVTGGGKGITAECALSLARASGVRLALLGRSHPASDAELAANLERMRAAGLDFRYLTADVTQAQEVQAAVQEVERVFGPVTGILHGAARNVPQLLRTGRLDEAAFRQTFAPKLQGARNLLAAINPEQLRLFVTFGSIIARIGLPGEADYGLANEWLVDLTEQFQRQHPACRCLAVEWSVWSGAGMGDRLGRLDALIRQGITPIPLDQGIAMLHRLLAQGNSHSRSPTPTSLTGPATVVVTGRFGTPPTLQVEQPELPFWRFLEAVRVYYPGVELVGDTTLSVDTDPYLADHVFRGQQLLPAVMGLEAMAQAAMALVGTTELPIFEAMQFDRPVVVPDAEDPGSEATVTIRLAALVRAPGQVEVVLRSEETAFQVDHFRATCRFAADPARAADPAADPVRPEQPSVSPASKPAPTQFPPLELDPERELYKEFLFHRGRFKRLKNYRQIMAKACLAEIATAEVRWFGRYLPADVVLGDPGARDAAIHAIQVCVPQATLLPVGVERLALSGSPTPGPRFVQARERSRQGSTFVYDLDVTDAAGHLLERWQGLRLHMVGGADFAGPWPAPLLAPYLERQLAELLPGLTISVTVERDPALPRRSRSDRAIQRALSQTPGAEAEGQIGSKPGQVQRRPDGKPEIAGPHPQLSLPLDGRGGQGVRAVSAAHAGDLTLAIAGPGPIGCDLEFVAERPIAAWQDLLGPERFQLAEIVAQEAREDLHTAATRVWAAGEGLKKAGAALNAPLVLSKIPLTASSTTPAAGWVLLSSSTLFVATLIAQLQDTQDQLILAVVAGRDHANL